MFTEYQDSVGASRWQRTVVVAATVAVSFLPSLARAQTCTHLPSEGNETAIEGWILGSGSCLDPHPVTPANGLVAASDNFIQGGWLKKTATFDVHTRAMTAGKCTLRFNSGWPPSCTAEGEQLRTVNKVKVTVAPPGLIPTTFSRFSLNEQGGTVFRQLLDTSVPGTTSGPLHRTANYVGRYVYDFQSVVNMTSCDIAPPNSEIKTRHLNVAECRTRFGYFNGKVIHLPAQSVSVYLPPSLAGDWAQPLQDAVDSWNDRLAGTAYPHLTVVNVDCGSGGDCVEIKEGPPTGQTCAAT